MAWRFEKACILSKRSGLNLQLAAAHVLRDVIDQGRSLDKTLTSHEKRVGEDRHALLQEMTFGGCRYYYYLDGLLSGLLDKPIRNKDRIVHFLLVVGLYQLAFMRTPNHAAVDQTVKALVASKQSWARGLVNGVLRAYLRQSAGQPKGSLGYSAGKTLSTSQQCSFPPFLFSEIQKHWPEYAARIFAASIQKPPMILRVNLGAVSREDYLRRLADSDMAARATGESQSGVVIDQPVGVDKLPGFTQGWVSVQDESAQLCIPQLRLSPLQHVLDGCAAPGGKTCAILESEPDVVMTAVDLPERVDAIQQNLHRLGLQAEIKDGELEALEQWWDGSQWDRILLDVPCSGSGVIRRHPDILHRREPGDLERFAAQQVALLNTAWPLLKEGGCLLYVTCSIMPVENDGVIARFLSEIDDAIVSPLAGPLGIATDYGIQRLPGVHEGDGFYYCRLDKM